MNKKSVPSSDLAAWNAIASEYTAWLAGGTGNVGRAFQRLIRENVLPALGKVKNKKILDIGCGEGYWARYLTSEGAKIFALDGAANMLAVAHAHPDNANIDFILGDLLSFTPFTNDVFDIVLCNMVLMDMQYIDLVFDESYRVLQKGGKLVFSVVHPCFYEAIGDWEDPESLTPAFRFKAIYRHQVKYLKQLEGLPANSWLSHYNRPIEAYIQPLIKSGFYLSYFSEPGFNIQDLQAESLPPAFYRYVTTANYLVIAGVK